MIIRKVEENEKQAHVGKSPSPPASPVPQTEEEQWRRSTSSEARGYEGEFEDTEGRSTD